MRGSASCQEHALPRSMYGSLRRALARVGKQSAAIFISAALWLCAGARATQPWPAAFARSSPVSR